jgi:hypothetical protein
MCKKIYVAIALCFTLTCLNAQGIFLDRIEEDGIRQIMTQTKSFSIDQSEFNIGLEVFVQQDTKHWFLMIGSYLYLSQDNEVLLKLGNDEVIHLKVNNVHVGQVNSPTYAVTNDFVTTIYEPTKKNLYLSTYVLTESDMDKIDLHGIVKIRISLADGFRDKVYRNNTLGKHLTKSRSVINNLIKEPNSTKDLYQGF